MSKHRIVFLRMLELIGKLQRGQLTAYEREDLFFCRTWLVEREWKTGLLETKSLMAYQTNDHGWQHEICKELELLDT